MCCNVSCRGGSSASRSQARVNTKARTTNYTVCPGLAQIHFSQACTSVVWGSVEATRHDASYNRPTRYTLDWRTANGGGGIWSDIGGQYELDGTAGQPEAGLWGDDVYALSGGFWGGVAVQYRAYLPLIQR